MKVKTYPKKDGSQGTEYILENGDVVVSRFNQVRSQAGAIIDKVTGKPVPTMRHYLGVTDKKFGDIIVKITDGQKKVLEKTKELSGKTITVKAYKNDFGQQVGVSVN